MEEQLGALPAGRAAPDLVDHEAVRPRERVRRAAPASGPGGARQLVAQLAGLDMIRPRAPSRVPVALVDLGTGPLLIPRPLGK